MIPGVFVPARDATFYLLQQHRQPLAANIASTYIEAFTAPGDLVLDPFAASATVARVAVELGRRAIAVDSNPLVAFAARVQATLPAPRAIANALARLGELRKEPESLTAHIENLYASVCANCGERVIADYFVWNRELGAPIEKMYACDACGSRRDPTSEADRTRAAEFKAHGFHYHLIVERLTGDELQYINRLRELLKLYTPRNLYALVTVTLKLDTEFANDAARPVLNACLLHALDVGTSLYSDPEALPERKIPDTFVEVNIWRALEATAAGLSTGAPNVTLAPSPLEVASAQTPTMFVGHGAARSLAETAPNLNAALILSSPARLDPTFWELSFLWARWLLGKQAARSLEPFLDEKRQRWGWYGSALTGALRDAAQLLRADGHAVFAFPAGSHAMIEALCLAGSPVLHLESFAFRPHRGALAATEFGAVRGDYQVVWSRRDTNAAARGGREVAGKLHAVALRSATEMLTARGEPLTYSWLHHNALRQFAREGLLAETLAARLPGRDNAFQFLRRELEAGLKEGYTRDLDHWKEAGRVLWLRQHMPREVLPLAERVEQAAREILANAREIKRVEFEDRLLAQFPELLTPEIELVDACAQAYAERPQVEDTRKGGVPVGRVNEEWHWRESDGEMELARGRELVAQLGARLNYHVVADERFDVVWRDEKIIPASSGGALREERVYEDAHGFIFRAQVDLRDLLRNPATPLRGLVILPEAQVGLVKEKLRRDPTLVEPLSRSGWEFLRVPFIELLLQSAEVTRAGFQLALGLDPPLAQGKEQMQLL